MHTLDRVNKSYNARIRKDRTTITHADLTDPDSGDHQDITLKVLPADAILLSVSFRINTYFTGGTASAVTAAIGVSGDTDSVIAAHNIFDTTVEDVWHTGVAGVRPHGQHGGETLVARIDIVDDDLVALTAGSLDVEVVYAVPQDESA